MNLDHMKPFAGFYAALDDYINDLGALPLPDACYFNKAATINLVRRELRRYWESSSITQDEQFIMQTTALAQVAEHKKAKHGDAAAFPYQRAIAELSSWHVDGVPLPRRPALHLVTGGLSQG